VQKLNQNADPRWIPLGGTGPLAADELQARIAAGDRCVRFEFCLSFLVATVRRQSPVYLTTSWQDRYLRGLGYSTLALLLGPWGVPWGLVWTPWAVWVNLTGGVDVTEEVLRHLGEGPRTPAAPTAD
jgi:hypothetical protein